MIENEPKDLEEFIDLTKANKEAVIPPRCPFSKTSDKNENRGMKIARPTPSYLFERGHPISQMNEVARPRGEVFIACPSEDKATANYLALVRRRESDKPGKVGCDAD